MLPKFFKNEEEKKIDEPMKRLLIEEARILSEIKYFNEKILEELARVKMILFASLSLNIITLIFVLIILLRK